jgi:cytoskeletal protein RodZ
MSTQLLLLLLLFVIYIIMESLYWWYLVTSNEVIRGRDKSVELVLSSASQSLFV